jgi:hypothetical protein
MAGDPDIPEHVTDEQAGGAAHRKSRSRTLLDTC